MKKLGMKRAYIKIIEATGNKLKAKVLNRKVGRFFTKIWKKCPLFKL